LITPDQLLTLPPDIVERAQCLAPAQREIVLLTLVGFSRAEIARLRGSKDPSIRVSLRWAQRKIGRIPYTVERRRGTTGTEEERARRRRSQRRRRERELEQRLDEHARATMQPLDDVRAVDFLRSGSSNLGAVTSQWGGTGGHQGRKRERRAA
jgi:hypothetical protein